MALGTNLFDLLGFVKDTKDGSGIQPSSDYMFKCLVALQTLCCVWWVFVTAKGRGGMKPLIQDLGVRVRRIKKVAGEIERKNVSSEWGWRPFAVAVLSIHRLR